MSLEKLFAMVDDGRESPLAPELAALRAKMLLAKKMEYLKSERKRLMQENHHDVKQGDKSRWTTELDLLDQKIEELEKLCR